MSEKFENDNVFAQDRAVKSVNGESKEEPLGDKLFPEKAKFMPDGIKKEYEDLVLKVKEANSEISEEEAVTKIFEVEKKYDHSFYWVKHNEAGARELVLSKRKFLAMEELNLLDEEGKKQLDLIKNNFDKVILEIGDLIGETRESCEHYLDKILYSGYVEDMKEAKDIIINGPKVKGFEETCDEKIPNKKVSEFLEIAFGGDVLRKSMIAIIDKDDKWLIKCDDIDKGNELIKKFNLDRHEGSSLFVAENEEDYTEAEMYLEDVDKKDELKHLHKLRATAGSESGFAKIYLHSFGAEKSEDYDYLKEHKMLTSEDKKRQAYILGTIGHEVAHKIEPRGKEDIVKSEEYTKIVEEETDGNKKFVSDYARRHKDLYGTKEYQVIREDFAETVRIFLTNADYLKTKYKQRYKFIKENYPFIKENSIVDILK